jgi:hypothetical protein
VNRFAASREQKCAVLACVAVGEYDTLVRDVDLRDTLSHQLDVVLRVELWSAKRDPLFRRRAGEIVLRQVGPVIGNGTLTADHRDRPIVALAAQHLRGGVPRGASTDNHHRAWCPLRVRRFLRGDELVRLDLGRDEYFSIALFDSPACDRLERRRAQRLTGAEAETGVMPRTADGVANEKPFGEWSTVVRTRRPDGEDLASLARDEHWLAVRVPREHAAVGQRLECDAEQEVRAG